LTASGTFASESYAQRDAVRAQEPDNDIVEVVVIPKARNPRWIGQTCEREDTPATMTTA